MSDTVRSATGRQRLRMCADAFLLAGLLFVLTQGALALLATALGLDEGAPPDWIGLLSPLLAVAAVVAGAVGSWRLHGRPLSRPAWAGLALGAVLGGPLASAGFMAVAGLSQLVPWPGPRRSEGPWVAVGLLTLVVVAFLALPVVDAVRDLAGARTSVLADRVRLAALLLTFARRRGHHGDRGGARRRDRLRSASSSCSSPCRPPRRCSVPTWCSPHAPAAGTRRRARRRTSPHDPEG